MVVVALRQPMPTSLLIVVIGSGHHRHHQPGSFWSSVVKCGVQNCKHPHHRRQRWVSSLSTRSVWGQADGFQSWVEIVGSRLGSRSIVFDVSFLSGVMLLQASLSLPSSAVVLIVVGQSQNVKPVSERRQGQKPGKSK
mgnify:CR=1 FL=1